MYTRFIIVLSFLVVLSTRAVAEKIDISFIEFHLPVSVYSLDTGATAVVLYENIFVEIKKELNDFRQIKHMHRVIHILKRDGLALANIKLYYPKAKGNDINNINGVTYDMGVNGQATQSILWGKDISFEDVSEELKEVAFSLSGVKEGSIIEYSFDIISPVNGMLEWEIQDAYPKLTSIFSIQSPKDLEFTSLSHQTPEVTDFGTEKEAKDAKQDFCRVLKDDSKIGYSAYWVRKNVGALKYEPCVISIPNYRESLTAYHTGLSFFTSSQKPLAFVKLCGSWEHFNRELVKDNKFGQQVFAPDTLLSRVADFLVRDKKTGGEKCRAIYSFVRDNFACNGSSDLQMHHDLVEVLQKRRGSITEINLLLTALLLRAGLRAAPILLSTAGTLSPSKIFPTSDRFNYTACAVAVDSSLIFLDASDKNNMYKCLPEYCYNGYARIIDARGTGLDLSPTALSEKTLVTVKVYDVTDSSASIEINEKMGHVQSSTLRKLWAKNGSLKQRYLDDQQENLPSKVDVSSVRIENENNPDTTLFISYKGTIRRNKGASTWDINSDFVKGVGTNPFTGSSRKMPIEFPYKHQYQYHLTIALPVNFKPEALPEPARWEMDSAAITYNRVYNYYREINTVTLKTTFNINTTSFNPSYYETIQSFFAEIVKQEAQVISLKKVDKL